ncbi:MAG: O-antigen ligase family protein [Victivallaceae bacterium]
MRPHLKNIASAALLTFSALLPLKAGSLVMPDSIPIFQDNFLGYVIGVWPRGWFYIGAALVLGLCLPAFSGAKRTIASAWFVTLYMLTVALACLGGINATRGGYVIETLTYLLALAAYFESVRLFLADGGSARSRLIGAWSVGILLALLLASHQYLWGFDDMKAYLDEQRTSGVSISAVLDAKIADRRTHVPFDLPNSLAGFLLLALPVLTVGTWRFCSRFEPPKLTQYLITPLVILAGIGVFVSTRSRAAFLALALALAGVAVIRLKNKWLRGTMVVLLLVSIIVGAFMAARSGRGLQSIRSRLDYDHVAAHMLARHPLAGAGWGEFYYEYMMNKSGGTEESPHSPHNVVLAVGSQAGVFAMFAMIAVMLWPFAVLIRRNRRGGIDGGVMLLAFGLAAFSFHSLADVNGLVPASAALWGAVALLVVDGGPATEVSRPRRAAGYLLLFVVLALALLNIESSRRLAKLDDYQGRSAAKIAELAESAAELGAEPAYFIASAKLKNFDPAAAERMLDLAINSAPRDPGPWIDKMELYLRQGRMDDAETALSEAIARFPDNWLLSGTASQSMENIERSRSMK